MRLAHFHPLQEADHAESSTYQRVSRLMSFDPSKLLHTRDRYGRRGQKDRFTGGRDPNKAASRAMSETRFRRIARLEKLAKPYLELARQTERQWERTLQGTAANAAILAFLIRYGNPNIGEPLSCACRRASESSAWKECCEKFPSALLYQSKKIWLQTTRSQ